MSPDHNSWVIMWGDYEALFMFSYWRPVDGVDRGPIYFKTRKDAHKRCQKLVHQLIAADLRVVRLSEYLEKTNENRNNGSSPR